MFDVGFWELALIGVIALVILGPDRLPRAARELGLWMGRARRMVAEVKRDISRELDAEEFKDVREIKGDLDSARGDVEKLGRDMNTRTSLDAASAKPKSAGREPDRDKQDTSPDAGSG